MDFSQNSPIAYYIYSVSVFFISFFGLIYSIKTFSTFCPKAVKTTVFIYFFTTYISFLVLFLSMKMSWIQDDGKPSSQYGKYVISFFDFFIDIKTEFYIVILLFSIAVVPLFFSYIVCGLVGIGKFPLNIYKLTRFLILFYAKSLLTFSAIGISFFYVFSLTNLGQKIHVPKFLFFASSLSITLLSFLLVFILSSWGEIQKKTSNNKIIKKCKIFHNFMTRKE